MLDLSYTMKFIKKIWPDDFSRKLAIQKKIYFRVAFRLS